MRYLSSNYTDIITECDLSLGYLITLFHLAVVKQHRIKWDYRLIMKGEDVVEAYFKLGTIPVFTTIKPIRDTW
jgi:hypothetical protein